MSIHDVGQIPGNLELGIRRRFVLSAEFPSHKENSGMFN